VRLGHVLFSQFTQALFAVDAHEDSSHQGDQRLIGADIRCRLLAADVLLAGGQRQTERAISVRIGGFAH